MTWALRATRRCLADDLRLVASDDGDASRDLEAFREAHLAVRDFLNQRSQVPGGTEGSIRALGPEFRELKCSRDRGVTLHEERPRGRAIQHPDVTWPGVVWLLAVGYRKEDDKRDAFEDFKAIGADAMRPRDIDYADLFADMRREAAEALAAALRRAVRETLAAAQAAPGTLQRMGMEPYAGVAVKLFAEHGHRILVLPTVTPDRRAVPEEVQVLIVQLIFAGLRLDELDSPNPRLVENITGYRLEPGEFALSYRRKTP